MYEFSDAIDKVNFIIEIKTSRKRTIASTP